MAAPVGAVCSSFKANPFKKDICANCQKGRALHSFVESGPTLKSHNEPCNHFVPNPFKADFCKTCQQGKHLHAPPAQPETATKPISTPIPKTAAPTSTPAPIAGATVTPISKQEPVAGARAAAPVVESRAAPSAKPLTAGDEEKPWMAEGACDGFVANPFKPTLCKRCRLGKAEHKTPPSTTTATGSTPAVLEWSKEGACDSFVPNPFKPTLCKRCRLPQSTHVIPPVAKEDVKAPASSEAQQGVAPASRTVPEAPAVICADFKAHAFKKEQCVHCGYPKGQHQHVVEAVSSGSQRAALTPKVKPADSKTETLPSTESLNVPAPTKPEPVRAKPETTKPVDPVACGSFRPHAFKKEQCVECGLPRSKHQIGPTAEQQKHVPLYDAPQSTTVSSGVASHRAADSTKPSVDEKSDASESHTFRPHPFKTLQCAECGRSREAHKTGERLTSHHPARDEETAQATDPQAKSAAAKASAVDPGITKDDLPQPAVHSRVADSLSESSSDEEVQRARDRAAAARAAAEAANKRLLESKQQLQAVARKPSLDHHQSAALPEADDSDSVPVSSEGSPSIPEATVVSKPAESAFVATDSAAPPTASEEPTPASTSRAASEKKDAGPPPVAVPSDESDEAMPVSRPTAIAIPPKEARGPSRTVMPKLGKKPPNPIASSSGTDTDEGPRAKQRSAADVDEDAPKKIVAKKPPPKKFAGGDAAEHYTKFRGVTVTAAKKTGSSESDA